MKIRHRLLAAALCAATAGVPAAAGDSVRTDRPPFNSVYVIPVSGEVEPGMAAFIGRALREALTRPGALIIVEMNTFGGRVDAAYQIVDTLLTAPASRTVAFVSSKAISAGALIALSCGRMFMRHNTTIGDCAPIMMSNEGPQMMGEKFQSPLRAKFRALAKRNGYPQALTEAMVSTDRLIYRVETPDSVWYADSVDFEELPAGVKKRVTTKKTVVSRGELLTMDDVEARDLGFSQASVETVDDICAALGMNGCTVERFEQNWSETFVRFITKIAPILMLIGFAGIYIEMKTPGFGLPGIAGLLCLALVFLSQYMVGLADFTELLLLAIGVTLLLIEVFVTPGFGLIGFAGIGIIAVSMVLSLQNFVLPQPSFPWQTRLILTNVVTVFGAFLLSFVVSLLFLRFVVPGLGSRMSGPYLTATLKSAHVDSGTKTAGAVGDRGVVVSTLRPAGKVRLDADRIVDVVTDGEFYEAGTAVVVSQVSGNRIVVTKA